MTEINTGDGVMVKISNTPRSTQATSLGETMFCKEDCAKLSMEKRTELFDKIILKKLDTMFTEVSISLTDVEKLDATYNIAIILVDRVRNHFIKYDLHGVFNIVDMSSTVIRKPIPW
jgi:ribonuclease HII